ncbi:MAG TPA: hypothetical protein VNL16_03115, partial [Chloroflexota bacterium]|nr:hypothetical protein [Chloroflexota bacterium]
GNRPFSLYSENGATEGRSRFLRSRFASDDRTPGARKDGPNSYARFLADPGRRDLDARRREDAAAVVDQFLRTLAAESRRPMPGDHGEEGP